jgi:DNA-directed RNA polymerase sigma subunit (sigma70/sigma32)
MLGANLPKFRSLASTRPWLKDLAREIVEFLVTDNGQQVTRSIFEASVHRPATARPRQAAQFTARKPVVRAGRQRIGLTQKEVAVIMKLSERSIRQIEKRAIRKLMQHPALRQIWRDYLAGELDEDQLALTRRQFRFEPPPWQNGAQKL